MLSHEDRERSEWVFYLIGAIAGFKLAGLGGAIIGLIIGLLVIGGGLIELFLEGVLIELFWIVIILLVIVGFIWLIVASWNVGK
jgi:hypothetical protein